MRLARSLLNALLVLLTLVGVFVVFASPAGAATPGTPTTNVANFLDHVPVPYVASVLIAGNVIPYLGHLLTRWPATRSGYLAGVINVGFALISAVLSAVAASDEDHWLHIAAVTVVTFLVARVHLRAFIKNTPVEAWLARSGVKGTSASAAPGAAAATVPPG